MNCTRDWGLHELAGLPSFSRVHGWLVVLGYHRKACAFTGQLDLEMITELRGGMYLMYNICPLIAIIHENFHRSAEL